MTIQPQHWPTQCTPSWTKFQGALQKTQTAKSRYTTKTFSIEGLRLLERALDEEVPIHGVLLAERMVQAPNDREETLLRRLIAKEIPLHVAPTEHLQEQVQGRTFGLCLGLVALPNNPHLEDLLAPPTPRKVLVLVEVMDPGNLGAMMRTGAASGIDALITWGGTDPYHPKAARTSMGAIFVTHIVSFSRKFDLVAYLKGANIETIGAVVEGGTFPDGTKINPRHALFMGSEAHGLPQDVQSQLDRRWSIPMSAGVDSFSVNAAAAILLYESLRLQP